MSKMKRWLSAFLAVLTIASCFTFQIGLVAKAEKDAATLEAVVVSSPLSYVMSTDGMPLPIVTFVFDNKTASGLNATWGLVLVGNKTNVVRGAEGQVLIDGVVRTARYENIKQYLRGSDQTRFGWYLKDGSFVASFIFPFTLAEINAAGYSNYYEAVIGGGFRAFIRDVDGDDDDLIDSSSTSPLYAPDSMTSAGVVYDAVTVERVVSENMYYSGYLSQGTVYMTKASQDDNALYFQTLDLKDQKLPAQYMTEGYYFEYDLYLTKSCAGIGAVYLDDSNASEGMIWDTMPWGGDWDYSTIDLSNQAYRKWYRVKMPTAIDTGKTDMRDKTARTLLFAAHGYGDGTQTAYYKNFSVVDAYGNEVWRLDLSNVGYLTAINAMGTSYGGIDYVEVLPSDNGNEEGISIPKARPDGDLNGDYQLDEKDLLVLQRYLNGWSQSISSLSDMTHDGKINNKDYALLQQIFHGVAALPEHTFEQTVLVAATCQSEGILLSTCTVCAREEYQATSSLAHIYDNDCDPACNTCTQTRNVSHEISSNFVSDENCHWHTCSICDQAIDKSKHTSSDWIVDRLPSEDTGGVKHRECTVCSAVIQTVRTAPIGQQPIDSSNGMIFPQLISTVYATDDVVIADIVPTEMGYAVDPTGVWDSTAGIQKALNDCAKAGGGTVFLPAGRYRLTSLVTVPPFVTLRGDWQDPDLVTDDYGTLILADTPSSTDSGAGLFLVGGAGGVLGLTVYYPNQSVANPVPYAHTFYVDGIANNYMLSTIQNVTVINGYRGIGACVKESNAHEQLTVENFKGTFLYTAMELYNEADVGTFENIRISADYWINAVGDGMTPANSTQLKNYLKANTTGMIIGDLEWAQFSKVTIEGCKLGIDIVAGKRTTFAGTFYDLSVTGCTQGILVRALDTRWGMLIARSTVQGGIVNQTGGTIKLCGVSVSGGTSGTVVRDRTGLSSYQIDYDRSYVKPAPILYLADIARGADIDVSEQLQAILDDAGKTGGVVYLPAGVYRLDRPITVPAGVELRGASSIPIRSQTWQNGGSIIFCYYGEELNPYTADALITLDGRNAGLNGIQLICPENGPYDTFLNTAYAVRGKGQGVYFVNSSLNAFGYGVDFSSCDGHFIKKVTTGCYYNTFLLGGENGMITGCLQNGCVVSRCYVSGLQNWILETELFRGLFEPTLLLQTQYIVVDGAKNQVIHNTFCYGTRNMVINRNSTGTLLCQIGADNNTDAMLIIQSGSMTAVNVMRYNGYPLYHFGGTLRVYNRLAINDKSETSYVSSI